MATELREARIKVVLDLEESKGEAKDLEKSVDKTARKQKKAGEESESKPGRGAITSKKIAVRQLAHGGLFAAITSVLRSLPLGFGAGFAIALGAAELNERFGPGLEALVKSLLPDAMRIALEKVGIDLDASAEMSSKWSETKALLSSIGQAFDRTTQIAAATGLTGGAISPADAKEEFGLQREMAKFEIELLGTRRRILQIKAGESVGKTLKQALENSTLKQTVGK